MDHSSGALDLALATWRLERWLNNLQADRKMAAKSSLRSIKRYLSDQGVNYEDPIGRKYDPGLFVDVINNEAPGTDEKDLIIIETTSPIILQGGVRKRPGRVVLGKTVKELKENHGREVKTRIPLSDQSQGTPAPSTAPFQTADSKEKKPASEKSDIISGKAKGSEKKSGQRTGAAVSGPSDARRAHAGSDYIGKVLCSAAPDGYAPFLQISMSRETLSDHRSVMILDSAHFEAYLHHRESPLSADSGHIFSYHQTIPVSFRRLPYPGEWYVVVNSGEAGWQSAVSLQAGLVWMPDHLSPLTLLQPKEPAPLPKETAEDASLKEEPAKAPVPSKEPKEAAPIGKEEAKSDAPSGETKVAPPIGKEEAKADAPSGKTKEAPPIKMEEAKTDAPSGKTKEAPPLKEEAAKADAPSGKTKEAPPLKEEAAKAGAPSEETKEAPSLKEEAAKTDTPSGETKEAPPLKEEAAKADAPSEETKEAPPLKEEAAKAGAPSEEMKEAPPIQKEPEEAAAPSEETKEDGPHTDETDRSDTAGPENASGENTGEGSLGTEETDSKQETPDNTPKKTYRGKRKPSKVRKKQATASPDPSGQDENGQAQKGTGSKKRSRKNRKRTNKDEED